MRIPRYSLPVRNNNSETVGHRRPHSEALCLRLSIVDDAKDVQKKQAEAVVASGKIDNYRKEDSHEQATSMKSAIGMPRWG